MTTTGDDEGISRAQLLAGAAGLGLAGLAAPAAAAESRRARSAAPRPRRGVPLRGVGYEVADGETPQTSWSAERMRGDLRAIADDLRATSVSVFGDGVERLTATATAAVERGLHVWLQPRLGDRPPRQILDHLGEVGRQARELRRQGARVTLSVGAEFVLFVPGIVPGADALERVAVLRSGRFDRRRMQRRLDRFVARAARVGRAAFDGPLTYGAAIDERVDWRRFDVVCANYYPASTRRSDHARDLRPLRRWGKPVAISEFGTCTYRGAPRAGGLGWDVLDRDGRVRRGLVRSERTQADYLVALLRSFATLGLEGAIVYDFVTPDAPHRRDPRQDQDLGSYGIAKAIWGAPTAPTDHWRWEPKLAYRALADAFPRTGPVAAG
ncbi:abortive phage infection protein [Patulibacter defluvii]|uniref:abortive phage infection protein n=1 Tax=Patulibacter defluvii TaxID=3095358 RepID=UPI002A765C0F|nr:abortive phage infection protein [Patulibacter sp. DM4]